MKKVVTLTLAICGIVFQQLSAQTVIWGHGGTAGVSDGEFNGSLGAWTTGGGTSNGGTPDANAKWVWSSDGSSRHGLYGSATTINSTTVANGAAIFDSDSLDTGGPTGAQGTGPAKGPQEGYLESPTVNCSGHPSVSVKFNNYIRNFQSRMFITGSPDNGVTWPDTIEVNNDTLLGVIATNASANDVRSYALAHCGGASQVKVRFNYSYPSGGQGYYFWLIDDVAFIETPAADIKLSKAYYSVAGNYSSPVYQQDSTFNIVQVGNRGSQAQTVWVKLKIVNGTTTYYMDSTQVTVNAGTSSYVNLPPFLLPANAPTTGNYTGTWSVSAPTGDDPADNSGTFTFTLNTNKFQKDNGTIPATSRGIALSSGAAFRFGNHYFVPNAYTQCNFAEIAVANATSVRNTTINVELDEWVDANNDGRIDNNEVNLVGSGSATIGTSIANNRAFQVQLQDVNTGNNGVVLNAGSNYLMMVVSDGTQALSYTTTPNYLATLDANFNANRVRLASVANTTQWYGAGFGFDRVAVARMVVGPVTNVNQLADTDVKAQVSPNPTSDMFNAAVNFTAEQASVNYQIVDMNGVIVYQSNNKNVKSDNINLNISNYAAGSYSFVINTPKGSRSINFVVAH